MGPFDWIQKKLTEKSREIEAQKKAEREKTYNDKLAADDKYMKEIGLGDIRMPADLELDEDAGRRFMEGESVAKPKTAEDIHYERQAAHKREVQARLDKEFIERQKAQAASEERKQALVDRPLRMFVPEFMVPKASPEDLQKRDAWVKDKLSAAQRAADRLVNKSNEYANATPTVQTETSKSLKPLVGSSPYYMNGEEREFVTPPSSGFVDNTKRFMRAVKQGKREYNDAQSEAPSTKQLESKPPGPVVDVESARRAMEALKRKKEEYDRLTSGH